MVEFKLEEETGVPFLMEINGRFWGSLQLAIDAGVDFPMILSRSVQGDNMEPITEYQYGVRSRWLWGELDLLLMYLFKSRESLNLPDHHESRLTSALRILSPFVRNQRLEVLRLSDLGPWICETRQWFSR
jgi:predicted ATP-grasp superfamily ATP-dependent carboligase